MPTNGSGNGAAPATNGRAYPIEDRTYDKSKAFRLALLC